MTYLQDNPLAEHVAAFERSDWREFLRLIREQPPRTLAEVAVLEDLLDEYAELKLPSSRERWDGRLGAFIVALGHAPPGSIASAYFDSEWDWQRPSEVVALDIAKDNLRRAMRAGARLTAQYTSELISTAWRDDALARLQSIAQAEPEWFFQTACRATRTTGADDDRVRTLYELAARTGGFEALATALDGDYWWALWRAFSSRRAGEDLTRYALELLPAHL